MGFSSSKIKTPLPDQILKLPGIEEYDEIYEDLEENIKNIQEIRTELDLRFTDFIRALGADKL